MASHVALEARGFEESLATRGTEVRPFVIVLLSVKDGRISICEFSATILTLVNFTHPMGGKMLLKI